MKSELAIKRDEWFKSAEGRKCSNTLTLTCDTDGEYLKNRLEAAFLAGSIADAEVQQDICDKIATILNAR